MTALWLLWHSIAFDRTKYGAGVFALLLLAAIFVYLAETPNESVKYKSLFNRLTVLFLFTVLAVMGLQMAQMKSLTKPSHPSAVARYFCLCNSLCFAAPWGIRILGAQAEGCALLLFCALDDPCGDQLL